MHGRELDLKYIEVQKEFIPIYAKRKKEFLKCLTQRQIALLEFAQRALQETKESASSYKEEVQNFRRKWAKVLFSEYNHLDRDHLSLHRFGMTDEEILRDQVTKLGTPSTGAIPWITYLKWSWWRPRKEWRAEKLVDRSLIKLKKLVDMGPDREILLIRFREEFLELFPETQEVNIWAVLVEIPQEVWRKIYRKFQLEFHPDKGGDQEVSKWLGKLNEGMKNLRKW